MPIYFVEEFERRLQNLQPVERKIFSRMVRGKTTREISRALDLSVRAVQAHRQHIIECIGTDNVLEMIEMARRARLPTIGDPDPEK